MNPVEQVISARQAEFQSAFEAAKQSATTFETKLNERLNATTQKTTTNVQTVTDAELARAREAYEALINKSETSSTTTTSSTTQATPTGELTNWNNYQIKPISAENEGKYSDLIKTAAAKYGVPEALIKRVIQVESNYNPNVVSSAGATGLMQLMAGSNRTDPATNIDAGTKELAGYIKKYDGDLRLALAAYNAGPGNVRKYGGVPPFKETQNYLKKIIG
ncbi:lytic transglycosylase domain-containing protein [Listeria cossartiae subsp. cayugensis]|uniref:Lytic transglycosylase domain-containing protein n=1 Tax=Listeria cossartiae subsp. cayugensis TaxID=2713505 RepID=A0ABU2ILG8_9LIST|nr:lytic transglycosylase domain-containing protein [Listeria cossartiae]MDT0049030.1 lytic transglycosylase domain-containing protein [Listeria cossartiae subsp. cayugensis]MDT0065533.1 lytic transglycosylase domain-containing protein [Listeria cossartiae subsp. cayugensis]MDT0078863.1 lytic transglycosylase domain-containing protein [Listeria cossartiae subsp. cayugensis]MDT0081699.1 lytic transglycosylase domain-containing protein [Listeria cossartiae subsp. cayugensis]MDT0087766.1 lytic tr